MERHNPIAVLKSAPFGRGSVTRRLIQLFLGLALYGLSVGLMVRSELGGNPWDVFHQGLSERSGLGLGTIFIIIGAALLLLWIPLRQRPASAQSATSS